MSPQEAALYADMVTIVAGLIILLVSFAFIEWRKDQKKICICTHKPERHAFTHGRCWDCKCHEFINDFRVQ